MSAFMVADNTINNVVSWLSEEVVRNDWFTGTVHNIRDKVTSEGLNDLVAYLRSLPSGD